MKFLKRLFTFIILIAFIAILIKVFKPEISEFLTSKGITVPGFIAILIKVFKPEISEFLTSKGITVPGVNQDIGIFPTSQTVTDADGHVSVVVSLPSAYADEFSQEQLNELVMRSEGRLVATKNPDGTATFTVSEEYRDELLGQISDGFDDSVLSTLVVGNVRYITHNADYSVFTVYCDPAVSESELMTLTGTKVNISGDSRGKLELEFYSIEELNRLIDIIREAFK